MAATEISALLIGMGLMAAMALALRRRDQPRLGAALGALALFEGLLTLFLSSSLSASGPLNWAVGWEMLALPALPILLRRHIDALTGTDPARGDGFRALAPGALLLPFLLLPPSARQAMTAGQAPDVTPPVLLTAVVSVGLFYLAWLAVTIACAWAIAIRLRRHQARLIDIYSTEGRGGLRGFRLMAAMLGVILCAHLGDMIAAGFGAELLSGGAEDVFLIAVILGVAVHGLSVEPPLPEWAGEALSPVAPVETHSAPGAPETRPAYARSGLSDADLDRILLRIDRAMTEQRLWSEPMLTLKDLAEAASVRPGYLSQALNQRRGTSFFDYVNGWRIDAACAMLSNSDKTALAIAQEAGFNAKSTFNAAFRKARGMSPTVWRASHLPARRSETT